MCGCWLGRLGRRRHGSSRWASPPAPASPGYASASPHRIPDGKQHEQQQHVPEKLAHGPAGLEALTPERGVAILSALLGARERAADVSHWVASPLAVGRLLRSRQHLADTLSSIAQQDVVATITAQSSLPTRWAVAASPSSAVGAAPLLAADVGARLAALAAHVLGTSVSADQPFMEVWLSWNTNDCQALAVELVSRGASLRGACAAGGHGLAGGCGDVERHCWRI